MEVDVDVEMSIIGTASTRCDPRDHIRRRRVQCSPVRSFKLSVALHGSVRVMSRLGASAP
jgi:hypothetical protein